MRHRSPSQVSLLARLTRGALWVLVGTLVTRAVSLLSSILVVRQVGPVAWGQLGMIQSTVGLFGTLAGFGIGTTATKYIAEHLGRDISRVGQIVSLCRAITWVSSLILGGLLFLLAPVLASRTLHAPELVNPLRVSVCLLVLTAVNGAQTGALAGFEAFDIITLISIVTGIISAVLTVVGAAWAGIEGWLWGAIVGLALNSAANWRALNHQMKRWNVRPVRPPWKSAIHVLRNFSLPALLSSILHTPITWACYSLLARQPNGYHELGIFNAANQWFTAVLVLPNAIGQALLPTLSDRLGGRDMGSSRFLMKFAIVLNGVVSIPVVIIGSVLSPWIMGLYGEAFAPHWRSLIIVVFTAGLLSIQSPVGQLLAASNRLWLGVAMNAGWGAVFLGLTAIGVHWGALGLAGARLGAYLVHGIWTFAFAFHALRNPPSADISTTGGEEAAVLPTLVDKH